MDGSFLSHDQVVAASRGLICIRLATYEDKQEAEFLERIFVGRSGALENTVFAILDANGKKLTRAGRGPHFAFENAVAMAEQLTALSDNTQGHSLQHLQLPTMKNVELALNVAACDGLPVAIVYASDPAAKEAMQKRLMAVAWDEPLAGQFVFATASQADELDAIAGVNVENSVLIVEPGPFGLTANVVAHYSQETTGFDIIRALTQWIGARKTQPKDYREHIRLGTNLGLDWATEVPVTDQQSNEAKKRFRGR